MCQSLCFNKAKGRRLATLFKKRLDVNFAECLKISIL